MKSLTANVLCATFILSFCTGAAAADSERAAVLTVANQGFKMIDAQQYDQCWARATDAAKNVCSKAQFNSTMNTVRRPLGKLLVRKIDSVNFIEKSVPGKPACQF